MCSHLVSLCFPAFGVTEVLLEPRAAGNPAVPSTCSPNSTAGDLTVLTPGHVRDLLRTPLCHWGLWGMVVSALRLRAVWGCALGPAKSQGPVPPPWVLLQIGQHAAPRHPSLCPAPCPRLLHVTVTSLIAVTLQEPKIALNSSGATGVPLLVGLLPRAAVPTPWGSAW